MISNRCPTRKTHLSSPSSGMYPVIGLARNCHPRNTSWRIRGKLPEIACDLQQQPRVATHRQKPYCRLRSVRVFFIRRNREDLVGLIKQISDLTLLNQHEGITAHPQLPIRGE